VSTVTGNLITSYFDLTNGTKGTTTSGSSSDMINVGDGWYRLIQVNPVETSGTTRVFGLYFANSSMNNITYSANIGDSIYTWGAQLEEILLPSLGSDSTSYIPTNTTIVTRNRDEIKKTNVSSLIGQSEGSILYHFKPNSRPLDLVSLNGITFTNNIFLGVTGNGSIVLRIYYNSNSFQIFGPQIIVGNEYKIGVRYKSGDSVLYVNGVSYTSSNTYTFTSELNEISFTQGQLNGWQNQNLYSMTLFRNILTNSELQQLTTL
jgi:hypothetical protein